MWVDLNRPTKKGYEKCGRKDGKGKYPLCKETPVTVSELTKKEVTTAKKSKAKVKGRGKIFFKKT